MSSLDKYISIDDILVLADKVSQAQLGGIEIEIEGLKLKIDGKKTKQQVIAAQAPVAPMPMPVPMQMQENQGIEAQPSQEAAQESAPAESESGTVVKSPIVGTFYAAPAPDKDPFVTVGQQVKKGDVLFIIESMKLMNEVLSEQDGVVKKIIANDGQAVEFGEPVMVIE